MTWGKIWWDVLPGQDASKLTALYEICSHSLCNVVYVHICHVYHTPNYKQTPLIQPQSWQIQLSKAPKEHIHSHVPWPFLIPQCDSYTWKWCYWILLMHHYLKAKPGCCQNWCQPGSGHSIMLLKPHVGITCCIALRKVSDPLLYICGQEN